MEAMHAVATAVARVLPLVREAGRTLAEVPPIVKPDGSPVTVGDYAAQAVLVHALRQVAPGAGFICEESAAGLRDAGRPDVEAAVQRAVSAAIGPVNLRELDALLDVPEPGGNAWWVIDPIDGTAGFVAGAHCSVCVALVQEGRTVLSAVGCPRLAAQGGIEVQREGPGCVVAAAAGGGTWVLDETGAPAARVHRNPWRAPLRWARSMNRRQLRVRAQSAFESLGVPLESLQIDSQCKYALIATGRADAAVRLPGARAPERAWDHIAGALTVSESGGRATDVRGRELDSGRGAALSANQGVLCAAAEVHEPLVAALGALLDREAS